MKGIGIKYQLRLTTLIPVLLVSILFALFYNIQFSNDLNQQFTRLGEASIRHLLPAAQFALMRNDRRTLQGLINATTLNPDLVALTFYDAQGHLIAYRGGKHSIIQPFHPPAFTGDYIENKAIDAYTINFVAPITIPQFNLYSKQPSSSEILGWVSLNMDTRSLSIKRYQMYIMTIFISLIGLLTSLSIHFFLSRRLYLPILRLRHSMKKILSNEFETPIQITSKAELGDIEQGAQYLQKKYLHTLNELNHHVDVATDDLQQSLEMLEEKNIELGIEKKKLEEKCQHKSEFIANMSHEIRTPMNGVLGFTNVLLESKLDSLQLDYVKTIKSSAQDLLNIINDILDYSKIDSGKLHLDCIPVDLRTCMDEVFALAAPQAHKKGIELIPSTDPNVPKKVLGDPLRIKQILTNLVNNAIKFTERGYVLVRATVKQESEHDYSLALSITDTGIGISAADQRNLFSAFNQADTSITRRFGGTGLGLVICQKLAEAMRGQISLSSELHSGSTFTINLTLEKLAAYEIEKHQPGPFSTIKALCFDENPLQLEALCHGLAYWGVTCVPLSTLAQLEAAFDEQKNCHMAFIHVDKKDEQQLVKILKAQTLPCVLIAKWVIHHPEALGAKAFLFKPVSIQKIHDTLEFLLEKQPPVTLVDNKLTNLRNQLGSFRPNLLIAEDNPINCMLLHTLLSPHASLEIVHDGKAAVDACQKKNYDLLLFDLNMPQLNGLEASRLVHQSCSLNVNSPVILISADKLSPEDLKTNRIECFISKPIDEMSLLNILIKTLIKARNSAIDWPLCIQKVSGNYSLAEDFLDKFVQELQVNRQEFIHLYNENNIKGLEAAAHKLKGACCFCGVPRLYNQVTRLEKQAKKAKNRDELHTVFVNLIQNMDEIFDEFDTVYRK